MSAGREWANGFIEARVRTTLCSLEEVAVRFPDREWNAAFQRERIGGDG